jgi:stage II sporulation protein D (peptidoglycan lytic transglycosylase)
MSDSINVNCFVFSSMNHQEHQKAFVPSLGSACLALALLFSCSYTPGTTSNAGSPSLRVCLQEKIPSVHLFMQKNAQVAGPDKTILIKEDALYTIESGDDGKILLSSDKKLLAEFNGALQCFYPSLKNRFGFEGKRYGDTIQIVNDSKGFYVINTLPVERYLESVVANEIGNNRKENELEAAKAQAIIARSYALMKIDLPLTRLFDVHDDTRDQVFSGTSGRSTLTSKAVVQTRGMVLLDDEKYAECYFHACCGGKTAAVDKVWPGHRATPYLQSIEDKALGGVFCKVSNSYRWTEEYSLKELEAIIKTYLPSADDSYSVADFKDPSKQLLDIKIMQRGPSGRVIELLIFFGTPKDYKTITLAGDKIRRALRRPDSKRILRSCRFDISLKRNSANSIETIRIDGGGNGHGIGMCQWGAIGRARNGYSSESILDAYFPGTSVMQVY